MLIFKNDDKYIVFIHIPKNSGKYIRKKIESNKKNLIIKSYWNIKKNLDLAHIPYIKKDEYLEKNINYIFFAYSRNPYDRIVIAFLYKNKQFINFAEEVKHKYFKYFVKNELTRIKFLNNYDSNIIHYYPQYLFVCDKNMKIENVKIYKIEDCEYSKKYNLKKYYDNECLKIINKLYENDFLSFGYEMFQSLSEIKER